MKSQSNPTFIDHLNNTDENFSKQLLNDPENNSGEFLRIFQNVDFHIPADDERMEMLVSSYRNVFNKTSSDDKDALDSAKQFMNTVLMDHALPDMINPDTGLLKDELLEVLDYKQDYDSKTAEQKKKITEIMLNAYIFYFLSAIFAEFEKTQSKDAKHTALDFDTIQKNLVTFENLEAIRKFKKYLEEDVSISRFAFANKLICDFVDRQAYLRNGFYARAILHYKLMEGILKIDPTLENKIQDCIPFYKLLGTSYANAAKQLLPKQQPGTTFHNRVSMDR